MTEAKIELDSIVETNSEITPETKKEDREPLKELKSPPQQDAKDFRRSKIDAVRFIVIFSALVLVAAGSYSIGSYNWVRKENDRDVALNIAAKILRDAKQGRTLLTLNDDNFQITKLGLSPGKYEVERTGNTINVYANRLGKRDAKAVIQSGELLFSADILTLGPAMAEGDIYATARIRSFNKDIESLMKFVNEGGIFIIKLHSFKTEDVQLLDKKGKPQKPANQS